MGHLVYQRIETNTVPDAAPRRSKDGSKMSLRSAGAPSGNIFVLARDPRVIATARDAARRAKRPVEMLGSGQEAISVLTAPGRHLHQVVCDRDGPGAASWPDLVAAAAEQDGPSRLLVVSDGPIGGLPQGLVLLPADSGLLETAFRSTAQTGPGDQVEVTALREAVHQRRIEVRYQPMVRLSDRRPVMVEALARWPDRYPPVAPDVFLPVAARAGLMRGLSEVVVAAAARDVGPLRRRLPVGLTINLPLDVLETRDLVPWLARILAPTALRPEHVSIELTEDAVVRDRDAFGRLVRRLRKAGHGIFLDDIRLDDPRASLFGCDIRGLKLDRSYILALSRSAAARQALRRLVRHAERHDQTLVAEGISHPSEMRLLAEMGVGWAQGFMISRPLPAAALLGWSELWRAGRPL